MVQWGRAAGQDSASLLTTHHSPLISAVYREGRRGEKKVKRVEKKVKRVEKKVKRQV